MIVCLILNLFFIGPVSAQEVTDDVATLEVVSHYPVSAYITDRLLPFTVSGRENLRVVEILLNGNADCSSAIDPYLPQNFHILCRQTGRVDLMVRFTQAQGEDFLLTLNNLLIAEQREPGVGGTEVIRTERTADEVDGSTVNRQRGDN